MKILHVNKFLYRRGGAEAYMLDLAEMQRERGHEVALFGMRHPENGHHDFARCFPSQVELDPPPPSIKRRFRATARMIWSRSAMRGIAEVLRRFQPDVAHLHNIYHQLSPSILVPISSAGVASVMTLHDYKLACPSYQLLADGVPCVACVGGGVRHAVVRRCKGGSIGSSAVLAAESGFHRLIRAYDRVDLFVCPSRFMAAVMGSSPIDERRLRVVPHFVEVPSDLDRGGGLSGNRGCGPPRIAYAGRLSPEKGVDTLVHAAQLVRAEKKVEFVIAGDGPERPRLDSLARSLDSPVRFVGRLDRRGTAELLSGSTMSVVPARWYENQPMSILESFGVGTPVVASRLGGIPELVQDGFTGRLVPPGSPDLLADALVEALADTAGTERMGRQARRFAEREHAVESHLASLETVYREAARVHSR